MNQKIQVKFTGLLKFSTYKNPMVWILFVLCSLIFFIWPEEYGVDYSFGMVGRILFAVWVGFFSLPVFAILTSIFYFLILSFIDTYNLYPKSESVQSTIFPLSMCFAIAVIMGLEKSESINPVDDGVEVICWIDSECKPK
jgi:hypothetical protein